MWNHVASSSMRWLAFLLLVSGPVPASTDLPALRAGTVNATVIAVSEYIWQRQRDPELQAGVLVGERLSAAWGLRPQDRELREALDAYLRLKKQSASWSRLVVKYFGADALAILDRASGR